MSHGAFGQYDGGKQSCNVNLTISNYTDEKVMKSAQVRTCRFGDSLSFFIQNEEVGTPVPALHHLVPPCTTLCQEFGKMENMGGMMEGLGGIDPAQAAGLVDVGGSAVDDKLPMVYPFSRSW